MRQFSTFSRLLAFLVLALVAQSAAAVCSIGVPGVAFGAYDPRSPSATDGAGTLTFTGCTAAYTISLSSGSSSSYAPRKMAAGPYRLEYNLYTDPGRNAVWGDGTGGTSVRSVSGAPDGANYTVYGRIPAAQNVGAGSYSDQVIVTVTF